MKDNPWARLLAYVTGLINQELLLKNEYPAAENRILRAHLPPRLRLSVVRTKNAQTNVQGKATSEPTKEWLDLSSGQNRCVFRDARFGQVRGKIDGHPFQSAFMAMGNGRHKLPVRADVRRSIGKDIGDSVTVVLEERI